MNIRPLHGIQCLLFSLALSLSSLSVSADYNAVDQYGTRVFSEVPAVGVHPRVIMSPSDIPAWREAVANSYRGKTFFAKRYQSNKIEQLIALPESTTGAALVEAYPHHGPGDNHELFYATMDVVYHQDAERAKELCVGITNFARVILARSEHHPKWGTITKDIGGIKGNDGIRTGLGELWLRGGADFALSYDYLYNVMTPEQRDTCREALSVATKDLICWGMNFPRGRGISNWYGYHGELGPMLLAIEGEEGYRHEQWLSFKQMMRDWVEVHFYETGGSNEDGYTINTSMREGQFTLIAMARRGDNLYNTPNVQNYFKWLALSLVPGEDSGETVGYSSNRALPYESAPVLARWAMPGNPLANYYLWRYKGDDYSRQNRWQYAEWSTLLGMNWEDSEALPLEMGKLGLPITHVFPYQGLFITRSDWSDDASYLNMLARQDAWYDRHENVDRGRFVFAALGRRWAVDNPWGLAAKSTDHSLVHIDGLAQAESKAGRGKAPNAQLIVHRDIGTDAHSTALLSYATMDLSNAYNWLWTHSWDSPGEGWEPETRSFEEIGWTWKRPGQPATLHGSDNKELQEYNFQGLNFWRKPHNTVEYCWRTGLLVRGDSPYTMIIDDVKKDNEPRTYDWQMPVAMDLDLIQISDNQFLLVEKDEERVEDHPVKGSRRLLVTCMGTGKPEIRIDEYIASTNRGKDYTAQRVIVSRSGDEAHFRIVLFPFHTSNDPTDRFAWKQYPHGAAVPAFTPAKSNDFSIKVGDQIDTWTFSPDSDGRNSIQLKRNNRTWKL